jgi:hypothetical protein
MSVLSEPGDAFVNQSLVCARDTGRTSSESRSVMCARVMIEQLIE